MHTKTGLIIGAGSGIAQAISRELSRRGYALVLAARDESRLRACAQDLVARGGEVLELCCTDFLDPQAVQSMGDRVRSLGQPLDVVVIAYGLMFENDACLADPDLFRRMADTNFTSTAICMRVAWDLFDQDRGGELVVLSSVAGDRARASNYFYGATKAALDAFVGGMRMAHNESRVNIMNVKPGPVDTPMTANMRKGSLWSSPEAVAQVVCNALGEDRHVVYAPRFWRYIMWVIRLMPSAVLARLPI